MERIELLVERGDRPSCSRLWYAHIPFSPLNIISNIVSQAAVEEDKEVGEGAQEVEHDDDDDVDGDWKGSETSEDDDEEDEVDVAAPRKVRCRCPISSSLLFLF